MKITVNKKRFALSLLTIAAIFIVISLIWVDFIQRSQLTILQIKLHPVVTPKVSSISIAPTASPSASPKATPTATLKFNPKTGVVK